MDGSVGAISMKAEGEEVKLGSEVGTKVEVVVECVCAL